jgi:hypothetical protein
MLYKWVATLCGQRALLVALALKYVVAATDGTEVLNF